MSSGILFFKKRIKKDGRWFPGLILPTDLASFFFFYIDYKATVRKRGQKVTERTTEMSSHSNHLYQPLTDE